MNMKSKYKNFIIDVKGLLRNLGRTNIITPRELDELFVKWDINIKELENEIEE